MRCTRPRFDVFIVRGKSRVKGFPSTTVRYITTKSRRQCVMGLFIVHRTDVLSALGIDRLSHFVLPSPSPRPFRVPAVFLQSSFTLTLFSVKRVTHESPTFFISHFLALHFSRSSISISHLQALDFDFQRIQIPRQIEVQQRVDLRLKSAKFVVKEGGRSERGREGVRKE